MPSPFREYYQQVTGIDTQELVGLRVVAINDVPVLNHFRDFGQKQLLFDDSDGGNTAIRWLYHHLFLEEEDLVEAGSAAFRIRNDKLNELNANAALLESLFVPLGLKPCFEGGNGPVCYKDLDTGEPLPLDLLDCGLAFGPIGHRAAWRRVGVALSPGRLQPEF